MANRGISVGQAGGEGLVRTTLICGVDYKLPEELAEPDERVMRLEKELRKIQATYERAAGDRPMNKITFTRMREKCKPIEDDLAKARAEVRDIAHSSKRQAANSIRILKRVFPQTTLQIRTAMIEVEKLIDVPREFTLVDGRVSELPLGGE
jgi:hypothetical protein